MMKSIKKSLTIVYIDHSVSIFIVKRYSLTSTNTNQLNLRLVRASQYLSIFELNVRHKLDKQNVISDTLSRLLRDRASAAQFDAEDILDALHSNSALNELLNRTTYVFASVLIEMSSEFKTRLTSAVKTNKR